MFSALAINSLTLLIMIETELNYHYLESILLLYYTIIIIVLMRVLILLIIMHEKSVHYNRVNQKQRIN